MLKPLNKCIVIRKNQTNVSDGGLYLPPTDDLHGEVVAVHEDNPDVKVGDHVLFRQHAGTTIEVDFEKLLCIHEDEILAVIE